MVLRVVALALLLLLTLVSVIALRTLQRVPDAVVYLVADQGTSFTLEPVRRRLGARSVAERVALLVEELARGPNADEAERGLSTAVPADARVLGAALEGGLLTVDLGAEFERGGGTATMIGRLQQLFYTLTQPNEVAGVILKVEGQVVEAFSGEGLAVGSPWWREEQPDRPAW